MKKNKKKKPVSTMPKGVWEGSNPVNHKDNRDNASSTASTDLQGNGYPVHKQSS